MAGITHSFEDFRQRYQAIHGHAPFVTEVVKWYWYEYGLIR